MSTLSPDPFPTDFTQRFNAATESGLLTRSSSLEQKIEAYFREVQAQLSPQRIAQYDRVHLTALSDDVNRLIEVMTSKTQSKKTNLSASTRTLINNYRPFVDTLPQLIKEAISQIDQRKATADKATQATKALAKTKPRTLAEQLSILAYSKSEQITEAEKKRILQAVEEQLSDPYSKLLVEELTGEVLQQHIQKAIPIPLEDFLNIPKESCSYSMKGLQKLYNSVEGEVRTAPARHTHRPRRFEFGRTSELKEPLLTLTRQFNDFDASNAEPKKSQLKEWRSILETPVSQDESQERQTLWQLYKNRVRYLESELPQPKPGRKEALAALNNIYMIFFKDRQVPLLDDLLTLFTVFSHEQIAEEIAKKHIEELQAEIKELSGQIKSLQGVLRELQSDLQTRIKKEKLNEKQIQEAIQEANIPIQATEEQIKTIEQEISSIQKKINQTAPSKVVMTNWGEKAQAKKIRNLQSPVEELLERQMYIAITTLDGHLRDARAAQNTLERAAFCAQYREEATRIPLEKLKRMAGDNYAAWATSLEGMNIEIDAMEKELTSQLSAMSILADIPQQQDSAKTLSADEIIILANYLNPREQGIRTKTVTLEHLVAILNRAIDLSKQKGSGLTPEMVNNLDTGLRLKINEALRELRSQKENGTLPSENYKKEVALLAMYVVGLDPNAKPRVTKPTGQTYIRDEELRQGLEKLFLPRT